MISTEATHSDITILETLQEEVRKEFPACNPLELRLLAVLICISLGTKDKVLALACIVEVHSAVCTGDNCHEVTKWYAGLAQRMTIETEH